MPTEVARLGRATVESLIAHRVRTKAGAVANHHRAAFLWAVK
jgi:hypothetical protein